MGSQYRAYSQFATSVDSGQGVPPRELGDFLSLWSIGTLFGKTNKVDMQYTREHGVVRILVGCMDCTKIPKCWSLLIKGGFYELSFQVEDMDEEEDEMLDDLDMGDDHSDHDDQGDDSANNKEEEDRDMDLD